MAELIKIAGKAYEPTSVRVKLAGIRFYGVKEIKWDQKRTRSKVPILDRSGAPVAMTRGFYEMGQVTVSMLKDSAQSLRQTVAALSSSQLSYGEPKFGGSIQYIEFPLPPIVESFFSLAIAGDNGGTALGSADPLYEDVIMDCLRATKNGLGLFDQAF